MRLIDLTGQTFGRLTVIERAPSQDGRAKAWWRCRCECGTERFALGEFLRDGRTNSCRTACVLAAGRRPWPRDPRYLVGEDGSVVGSSGRVLAPFLGQYGYLRVNTYAKGKWSQHSVHVIVCEAFHGPRPDGLIVLHGDGDPLNCRASNLRWGTFVENEADKLAHGRRMQGERHHQARLTEDDVRTIRARYAAGISSAHLARCYQVSPSHVRGIVRRKSWAHI